MYKVEILSNEEFKQVAQSDKRYSHVDDDNLGFADAEKKTAYVRHTAWPDLNKYLINHEFEHLLEEEGTDEDENGIRHKKKSGFGNFLRFFYNPLNIPGMGPLSNEDKGVFQTDNNSSLRNEGGLDAGMPEGGMGMEAQAPDAGTGSPLAGFSVGQPASGAFPQSEGSQVGAGLNPGTLNGGLNGGQESGVDPATLQRLKGFYSGRINF